MKVLIIDDDADIRSVASLSLSRMGGMEVIEAASGRSGVRKARVGKPDVILLDMTMPAMDGVATLAALRSQPETAMVPVIFLTGRTAGDELERATALGAAGVLIKPFDPRTLSDDVRALVNGKTLGAPASGPHALRLALGKTRQRFIATFGSQCDALGILADKVAASAPRGPVAALTRVTHRLSGLAGTIGFPTVSACASALEVLADASRRSTFDASIARGAVDAIRNAFAKDLASPSLCPTPMARGATIPGADVAFSQRAIRVLIVDDHAIVRRGLKALLSEQFRGAAFGEAGDAGQALAQLRADTWDVALLDITLPGKSGLELLKEVKAEWPALPVLVLSGHAEDQFAVRVLKAGAGGYMTKESAPEELVKAVRRILAGGRYVSPGLAEKLAVGLTQDVSRTPHETLSDREYDVMSRIASGKTVTEIGEELSLSVKTISTYRARVLEKLGLRNSAEVVHYAVRNGLVT